MRLYAAESSLRPRTSLQSFTLLRHRAAKVDVTILPHFMTSYHDFIYGGSTEANCNTLGKAHTICLKWAKKHGASFAPKKYELIHLMRSPKKFNMEATLDLGEHQVAPKTQELMTYEEHSHVVFEGNKGEKGKGMDELEGKGEDAGVRYRNLIWEAAKEVSEGACMVMTPEATVGRRAV